MMQVLSVGNHKRNCGNKLFGFYRNSTNLLPHDAESGCRESREEIAENSYVNFIVIPQTGFHMMGDLSVGNLRKTWGSQ